MPKIWTRLWLALALGTMVLAAGGCIFSPQDDDDPPAEEPSVYVWPDEPDELMANFENAYADMDIEHYEDALHDDYKFIFTNNDIWERQDDIASTENMFAGNPGTNDMAVQSIEIQSLIRQQAWTEEASDHPYFPSSLRAEYQVIIVFKLEGGTNTITVNSSQLFYAQAVEEEDNGVTKTRYYLVGQQDVASGS